MKKNKMNKIIIGLVFLLLAALAVNASYYTFPVLSGQELVVTYISQDPDPVEPGSYVELKFKVENEGAEAAEQLLERLIAEGKDGRNRMAYVESRIYNAIIDAYARSKTINGPIKAESLIKRMYERHETFVDNGDNEVIPARPDIVSYNSLLNAWCESERTESATKAEDIISFLESSDSPDPDNVTYNIMMNTYANQIGEYGYAQKVSENGIYYSLEFCNGERTQTDVSMSKSSRQKIFCCI